MGASLATRAANWKKMMTPTVPGHSSMCTFTLNFFWLSNWASRSRGSCGLLSYLWKGCAGEAPKSFVPCAFFSRRSVRVVFWCESIKLDACLFCPSCFQLRFHCVSCCDARCLSKRTFPQSILQGFSAFRLTSAKLLTTMMTSNTKLSCQPARRCRH